MIKYNLSLFYLTEFSFDFISNVFGFEIGFLKTVLISMWGSHGRLWERIIFITLSLSLHCNLEANISWPYVRKTSKLPLIIFFLENQNEASDEKVEVRSPCSWPIIPKQVSSSYFGILHLHCFTYMVSSTWKLRWRCCSGFENIYWAPIFVSCLIFTKQPISYLLFFN